jgi:hypothetical protein
MVDMKDKEFEKIGHAQRRIKLIKGFYYHLIVFVIFNGVLLISKDSMAKALFGNEALVHPKAMDWIYWNIIIWLFGLVIHGLFVFDKAPKFVKKWEEQQIKKHLNENT